MRRRAMWAGFIVVFATGCGGGSGDPFVDLGAEQPALVTVGPPAASEPTAGSEPAEPMVPPSAPGGLAASADGSGAVEPGPSPPPTEPGAPGTEAAALEAGFHATVAASVACLAAPADCRPESVTAVGGPEHERYGGLVANYAEAGYVVRRLETVSGTTIESTQLGSDGSTGFVVACDIDGDVVVEPGATNGFGLDLVINDLVMARRVRVELHLVEGEWRRWAIEQLGEWPMESTCPAG